MAYEREMEFAELDRNSVDLIDDVVMTISGYHLSDFDRRDISKLIGKFGFNTVIGAARTAFTSYDVSTIAGWNYAFERIGGICYNMTHKTCTQCVFGERSENDKKVAYCLDDGMVHYKDDAERCGCYKSRYERRK